MRRFDDRWDPGDVCVFDYWKSSLPVIRFLRETNMDFPTVVREFWCLCANKLKKFFSYTVLISSCLVDLSNSSKLWLRWNEGRI